MKFCFIDFEFNTTKAPKLNLVSAAWNLSGKARIQSIWLHKNETEYSLLASEMEKLKNEGYIFVAYSVVAEARSFISLGLDPMEFQWIDLFIDYRCLLNNDNKLGYGKQLIDGKVKRTFPPKPKWARASGEANDKPADGLAAACFKMLGKMVDTERKNRVRDIIISAPDEFTDEEKNDIIKYNISDIHFLEDLLKAIVKEYKDRLPKREHAKLKEEMLYRGRYAALTATREARGYEIGYEETRNFADSVPDILNDIQRDINLQFPELGVFEYNIAKGKFTWKQTKTNNWIKSYCADNGIQHSRKLDDFTGPFWSPPKGSSGISRSLDAWTKYFNFTHSYPRDNFGAQIVRYLKTKQNLNGFMPPAKGKKSFWDYVGPDKKVRPYLNIYGSQSARTQPSSTSFMFLKAAWMRSLVVPSEAMCGIDFGSEEFLIAGLLSRDYAMLDAYDSGDVYLWFGKACGKIPEEATKKTHSAIRDRFKSSVLGIQYKMGAAALGRKITNDTGEFCSEDDAQEYIDMFENTFHVYDEWSAEYQDRYEIDGYAKLSDGWYMWGDNTNWRSVGNFPVQGEGSVIMRKSDLLAYDKGLYVPFTLHDALYIEHKPYDYASIDILADCMDKGFRDCFDPSIQHRANIRLDCNTWSPHYEDVTETVYTPAGREVKKQKIYVDERSKDEYENFSKYFERDKTIDFL